MFVSSDEDRICFENYHRTIPLHVVSYRDLKTKNMLNQRFEVEGIPCLIMMDMKGKMMQAECVELIYKYGIHSFPFTPERLVELEYEEKVRHASQNLENLLVTGVHDYVIGHGGKHVSICELRGETVGLYFSAQWCVPCQKFTPRLKSVYIIHVLWDGFYFELYV